jgi:DNA-binding XRE family transcriptional regulator
MSGRRKWIEPQDFRGLRRACGLTRRQAAEALNVTERTIQNWENGGARIPWMAFKLLRCLRGFALPGVSWQGWTMYRGTLYSPDGRAFEAADLYYLQNTFAQAKLWRQMYSRSGRAKTAATVVSFPDRRATPAGRHKSIAERSAQHGGQNR